MGCFVLDAHAERKVGFGAVVRLYEVGLVSLGYHTCLDRSGATSVLLEQRIVVRITTAVKAQETISK